MQLANPERTNRMDSILSQEKKLGEKNLSEKADVEKEYGYFKKYVTKKLQKNKYKTMTLKMMITRTPYKNI